MTATTTLLTVEQYLALERSADSRHEYVDGVLYDMAGESPDHADISANLIHLVVGQLKGKPCRARTKDTKVRSGPEPVSRNVGKGMYCYPDIVVTCSEIEYHDKHNDIILNPTAITEVLSPMTEARDRGVKFHRFADWNPSLQDYILVSQNEPKVERFSRQQGQWSYQYFTGLDAVADVPSIACVLPLREVYDRIVFTEQP